MPVLASLERLCRVIDDHWGALLAVCRTEADLARMRDLRQGAWYAYQQALAGAWEAEADEVAQLHTNVAAVTAALDGRHDTTMVFAVLTTAVTFAVKVVSLQHQQQDHEHDDDTPRPHQASDRERGQTWDLDDAIVGSESASAAPAAPPFVRAPVPPIALPSASPIGSPIASPAAPAPPPRRFVNTWFDTPDDRPLPLDVGLWVGFGFNIGARRADAAAAVPFAEPDFGSAAVVALVVTLFSEDFEIDGRRHSLLLPRTGDSVSCTARLRPRHAGRCRVDLMVCLDHELDVLQTLAVEVEAAQVEIEAVANA